MKPELIHKMSREERNEFARKHFFKKQGDFKFYEPVNRDVVMCKLSCAELLASVRAKEKGE